MAAMFGRQAIFVQSEALQQFALFFSPLREEAMEIKSIDTLFEEVSKIHNGHAPLKRCFKNFSEAVANFFNGNTGTSISITVEESDGFFTIKSPIASIRVALSAGVRSEGLRGFLVVHRLPSDPSFEEVVHVAEIQFDGRGDSVLTVGNHVVNLYDHQDCITLALHLLQEAYKPPFAHRKAADITSG